MNEEQELIELYQPFRNADGRVIEPALDYAKRMKTTVLPNWDEEVLVEWLHRHADDMEKYAFLGFESFVFSKQVWSLEQIPGQEAFDDPRFCSSFCHIEQRAANKGDWLANYMLEHGTWNTPIVLLSNESGQHKFSNGEKLKQPIHLLEGHRRLSFLTGLRQIGRAHQHHSVWIVSKQT